jgi:hypothetical protein
MEFIIGLALALGYIKKSLRICVYDLNFQFKSYKKN